MSLARRLCVSLLVALALGVVSVALATSRVSASAGDDGRESRLEPLVDVHDLMESVVERTFEAAKKGLSEKPADLKGWKNVYSMSVLLGESGNLLLIRKPEEAEAKEWTALAVALRQTGQELMQAAKAKDYGESRKAYMAVVNACNKCHSKFGDDGEPKIEP